MCVPSASRVDKPEPARWVFRALGLRVRFPDVRDQQKVADQLAGGQKNAIRVGIAVSDGLIPG